MSEPLASRPHMPEYGITESEEGMLPWSWAEERLANTRNYWIGTVSPDRRPHSTAVWGLWHHGRFFLSMSERSLKARNLASNPNVVITTDQAEEAVILEGVCEGEPDEELKKAVLDLYREKYDFDASTYYFVVVRPVKAFGFVETEEQFSTAATRWRFD